MSDLAAKITITAVDHATAVVARIGGAVEKLKMQSSGLGAAWNNVSGAASKVARNLLVVGAAAAGAGLAVWGLTKHYAEMSEQLSLSATKSGVSVEALQRLQFSAKLANIETGKLDTGLKFLNKAMATSLVTGSKGKENDQAKAFKDLGISVKNANGTMKTADQTILEISDKFHNMTNVSEKVRIAQKLFGRAGSDLIPILSQGSAAIKAQGDELARLGHILTSKEIEANKHFAEDLKKLNMAVSGLGAVVASALIPVLTPLVESMTNWIAANKQWLATEIKDDVLAFGTALKAVWGVLAGIKAVIWPVVAALGGLKTVIIAIGGYYIASTIVAVAQLGMALYSLGAAAAVAAVPIMTFIGSVIVAISPILFVVAAIGLIGYALYKLISQFSEFKAAWLSIWGQIPQPIKTAMRIALATVTFGMSEIVVAVYNNWEKIKKVFSSIMDGIAKVSSKLTFGVSDKVGQKVGGWMYNLFHKNTSEPIKIDTPKITNPATVEAPAAIAAPKSMEEFQPLQQQIIDGVKQMTVAFQGFGVVVTKIFSTLSGLLNQTVSGINNISAALANVHAPNLGAVGGAGGMAHPATATPATGGKYSMLSPSNQRVDIHMKIDADGRPKSVAAKTDSNTKFQASTGTMV